MHSNIEAALSVWATESFFFLSLSLTQQCDGDREAAISKFHQYLRSAISHTVTLSLLFCVSHAHFAQLSAVGLYSSHDITNLTGLRPNYICLFLPFVYGEPASISFSKHSTLHKYVDTHIIFREWLFHPPFNSQPIAICLDSCCEHFLFQYRNYAS